MSRPNPSGTASGAVPPPPQVRRPQQPQYPGLPSTLRRPSSSSVVPPSKPSSASALPAHLLSRVRKDTSTLPTSLSSSSSSSSSATPSSQIGMGKGTPGQQREKLSLPARTSKTGKKLVFLPEDVQSRPIPHHPGVTNVPPTGPGGGGPPLKEGGASQQEDERGDERSEAEKMSKEERERGGFGRLTAYATAESYRLKALAAFLKREHGAEVRIFDEAIYAVYTLPLLPGYGANVKVRSSVAPKSPGGGSILHKMDAAEETGYVDSYFPFEQTDNANEDSENANAERSTTTQDGQIYATSPERSTSFPSEDTFSSHPIIPSHHNDPPSSASDPSLSSSSTHTSPAPATAPFSPTKHIRTLSARSREQPKLAEAIFFEYGVSVFFGFTEGREKDILEDCESGGTWVKSFGEEGGSPEERGWEMEETHFIYDPSASYPRIYNDLFTFKSPSHLLKLSLSHALAQSTKLSVYESAVQATLGQTSYIPKELAITGTLSLDRTEAVKMTGRLFSLRVEVNLVSNVLDSPELFWSEPSLTSLYDAVREYLEIDGRVYVLNEKLGVAGDLLQIIHEHVDYYGMHRITWIVIWLIVLACFVEFGEVFARLVFHGSKTSEQNGLTYAIQGGKDLLKFGY